MAPNWVWKIRADTDNLYSRLLSVLLIALILCACSSGMGRMFVPKVARFVMPFKLLHCEAHRDPSFYLYARALTSMQREVDTTLRSKPPVLPGMRRSRECYCDTEQMSTPVEVAIGVRFRLLAFWASLRQYDSCCNMAQMLTQKAGFMVQAFKRRPSTTVPKSLLFSCTKPIRAGCSLTESSIVRASKSLIGRTNCSATHLSRQLPRMLSLLKKRKQNQILMSCSGRRTVYMALYKKCQRLMFGTLLHGLHHLCWRLSCAMSGSWLRQLTRWRRWYIRRLWENWGLVTIRRLLLGWNGAEGILDVRNCGYEGTDR